MRDPMEDIVANALMSGDYEKGLREASCNAAARAMINCKCGAILDQETITVVEKDGRAVTAYCPECWSRAKRMWPEPEFVHVQWSE